MRRIEIDVARIGLLERIAFPGLAIPSTHCALLKIAL